MLEDIGGLTLFRFESFPRAGLLHAISTRLGGVSQPPYASLNISPAVHDHPDLVRENRRRFTDALGIREQQLITTRQVHGRDALVVDADFRPADPLPAADVQVTDQPGWVLTMRYADCVPVLLVDPERPAVAAVHAGWRGTQVRAAGAAVDLLRDRFGADPAALLAGIGPSIGPCCFEVGDEVAVQFADRPSGLLPRPGCRPHLDLWELNRLALVEAGVRPDRIELAGLCTRCRSDLFFSHRAHGFPGGRFMATIGLI